MYRQVPIHVLPKIFTRINNLWLLSLPEQKHIDIVPSKMMQYLHHYLSCHSSTYHLLLISFLSVYLKKYRNWCFWFPSSRFRNYLLDLGHLLLKISVSCILFYFIFLSVVFYYACSLSTFWGKYNMYLLWTDALISSE